MRFVEKLASLNHYFRHGKNCAHCPPGQPDPPRQGKGMREVQQAKELNSAEQVFSKCRHLYESGHAEEARALIAKGLPKVPLGSFADIGAHLIGRVWQSCLDTKRGIVWAVGDTGITLAISLAYPYDLHGNHLSPSVVAEEPGSAWWGYDGEPPIGLGLREPDADPHVRYATLVDAPGDDTLIFASNSGCRYAIDYNGAHIHRVI